MNSLFDELVTGLSQAIEYEKGNAVAKETIISEKSHDSVPADAPDIMNMTTKSDVL